MDTRILALEKAQRAFINDSSLPLYSYRIESKYYPVFGEGNPCADIMCIGEAPGKQEALTGKPFCGRSGKVLDVLFAQSNILRTDVYITNIVKDRPPENRDPSTYEIEAYAPFLDEQIFIIQPKIILTLGRFSMDYVLKKFRCTDTAVAISSVHGTVFRTQVEYGELLIVPLYHPAVAIYNPRMFDVLLKDFQQVKKLV